MDWQYVSIVFLLGIVVVFAVVDFVSFPLSDVPVSEKQLDNYWSDCDEPISLGQQADCDLLQRIEDLNG